MKDLIIRRAILEWGFPTFFVPTFLVSMVVLLYVEYKKYVEGGVSER